MQQTCERPAWHCLGVTDQTQTWPIDHFGLTNPAAPDQGDVTALLRLLANNPSRT
jgi:hypothetical protein